MSRRTSITAGCVFAFAALIAGAAGTDGALRDQIQEIETKAKVRYRNRGE